MSRFAAPRFTRRTPLSNKPPHSPSRVSSLVRGSAFIFACRLAGAALTFGSQVLLARWMGAAELGAYVIAFSWCILLGALAAGGLPAAAVRFVPVALAQAQPGTALGFYRRGRLVVLGTALALGLLSALGLLVAGPAVPPAYRLPLMLGLAAAPMLALITFFGAIANAFSWLLQSFLPGNVLRPAAFLAAIWVAVLLGARLDATLAMQLQLAAALVVMLGTAFALHRRVATAVGTALPHYETRRWMRTAAPLLGVSIFTGYLPEITVVLVGLWLPSDGVAIFQVSYRIALLIGFGLYAVDAFTAPEVARLVAVTDRDNLQRMVNRATRLRFWPALAAVAVLAVAGRPVLGIFGEEFTAGYVALVILAAAQLAQAAVGPVMRLMSVSGHEDACLKVSLGSLAALVPLVMLLTPRFGANGAALAAFLDVLLWSLWMRWLVARHLGVRPAIF